MGFASTAMGATQLGLNLVGDYMSWKDQRENAKAQARALSQQANAVGKNLAYTFQNYELQRVDAFDAAVNNLMKVQTNALGLESSVRAAINEETGGDSRTGRALQRAAHADTLRTLLGIKDVYERQSDEISLNKERWLNVRLWMRLRTLRLRPHRCPVIGLCWVILQGIR